MSFFLIESSSSCPLSIENFDLVENFDNFENFEGEGEEEEEEEEEGEDLSNFEDPEDPEDPEEDEDIGDVVDVTIPLWTMIEQVACHLSFEQIRHLGMVQTIQQFLDTETCYRVYVAEHDKWLEYSNIHDLLRGLHNYYQFHLPDTDKTKCLDHAFATIAFHFRVEQQIQDVLMEFEML